MFIVIHSASAPPPPPPLQAIFINTIAPALIEFTKPTGLTLTTSKMLLHSCCGVLTLC
jgi:hypothetical protein